MSVTDVGNEAFEIAWERLLGVLGRSGLPLSSISDIHDLDDLLDDGGQARVEQILDPADNFIVRFYHFSDRPDSNFSKARDIVITKIEDRLAEGQ